MKNNFEDLAEHLRGALSQDAGLRIMSEKKIQSYIDESAPDMLAALSREMIDESNDEKSR